MSDAALDAYLDGMASKAMSGKGNYLPPGFVGRVVLKALKWNPNGHKGKSAIFEYVLKTSNLASHPPGTAASWVIKCDPTNAYAPSDIKQIMMSIDGVDPATVRAFEVDPAPHNAAMAAFKAAIKDPDLVADEELDLQTVEYTTKGDATKKPQTIALHKWSPASAETTAAAA